MPVIFNFDLAWMVSTLEIEQQRGLARLVFQGPNEFEFFNCNPGIRQSLPLAHILFGDFNEDAKPIVDRIDLGQWTLALCRDATLRRFEK